MRLFIILLLIAFAFSEMVDEGILLREKAHLAELDLNTKASFKGYRNMRYTISFPSAPDTGYLWTMQNYKEGPMKFKGPDETGEFEKAECPILDGTGRQRFEFEAVEKGNITLAFVNKRPWEDDTNVTTYEVNMEIVDPC